MEEQFIALVKDVGRNGLLPEGWEPIVQGVLRAAGFNAEKVEIAPRKGEYRDQDGPTGEHYPLNARSGIAVGEEHAATIWLNGIWSWLRYSRSSQELEELKAKIEASRPLVPIVVSEFGEEVGEYPPSDVMGKHARDVDPLSTCTHRCCRGWVDRKAISRTHDALVCRCCHMRIPIPREVKTYGDLRAHFKHLQPT